MASGEVFGLLGPNGAVLAALLGVSMTRNPLRLLGVIAAIGIVAASSLLGRLAR